MTQLYERTIATTHPCLLCGACCAVYRVAFHWLESEGVDGVPEGMTQRLDPHRLEMRKQGDGRCVALAGEIGNQASCSIYERRPSVCRELVPAWENGQPSPQCDRARARFGLAPLTPMDWKATAPGEAQPD